MARVVYEDGDAEEAARLLDSVMPFVEALAEGDDVAELAPILAAQATIELARGRPAEALAIAADVLHRAVGPQRGTERSASTTLTGRPSRSGTERESPMRSTGSGTRPGR